MIFDIGVGVEQKGRRGIVTFIGPWTIRIAWENLDVDVINKKYAYDIIIIE